MKDKQRRLVRKLAWAVGASFGTVLLASGAVFAYFHYTYADTIAPNVQIAGLSVAGLTKEEAKILVQNTIDPVAATPVTLTGEDIEEAITPEKLVVVYDVDASVESAFNVGRGGNPILTVLDQIQLLLGQPINRPASVTFERKPIDETLDKINSKLGDAAVDADITLTKGKLEAVSEHAGMSIDDDAVVEHVLNRLQLISANRSIDVALTRREPTVRKETVEKLIPVLQPLADMPLTLTVAGSNPITVEATTLVSWIKFERTTDVSVARSKTVLATITAGDGMVANVQAVIDQKNVKEYLAGIAKQVDKVPVDAKLTIQNGKAAVFQISQAGRSLNQSTSAAAISDALVAKMHSSVADDASLQIAKLDALSIALVIDTVQPAVASDTIDSLGINQLIGTGSTDFSGSPSNRVHNITIGTKYLTGQIIKPGEEFSTVKNLGVIDGTTGYLPELVIKENKTIPEFGGGLCQVSTTLFRAVLNAGLPVTERYAHSYRVIYYERNIGPGLDATVYDPRPDFKFRNDTTGSILVQGSITKNTLKFELFGTSDGRVAKVEGPFTTSTTAAPADVDTVDESLAPGTRQLVSAAHPGASTIATYTVTRDGKEINRQVFTSKYKAMPAQYKVGPTPPPAAPVVETPVQSTDQPAAN